MLQENDSCNKIDFSRLIPFDIQIERINKQYWGHKEQMVSTVTVERIVIQIAKQFISF